MSILEWQIAGAPLAVVDVETTGFNPGFDKIVEISVVHLDGGGEPRLAFDSLIDPRRKIPSNCRHGITAADVVSAPIFSEIAGLLASSLSNRVIVAHNAYFDLRFLQCELGQLGVQFQVPYLCSMALRPALGLGPRATLVEACEIFGLTFNPHMASEDALATASLMTEYRRIMAEKGIRNFAELAGIVDGKYVGSWSFVPLQPAVPNQLPKSRPPVSRRNVTVSYQGYHGIDYTTALLEALADLVITPEEIQHLEEIKRRQNLTQEQVRAAHAGVFTWMISRSAADGWIDDVEKENLARIYQCLSELGWAPGQ